ncbi:MAG: hypothetical protein Q4F53_07435 [Nesterenkonia sp.]|uniref:hypothetical protein n=1 Tax=Nesterenkonia marinintestina TaxID=2979865 RepID=UPI0021C250E0|nr:hypothetical protein [Nesterenkonia sp. GX14115]MDO5493425.1 hypothetical protein [Nesterenkonia sp.]
MSQNRDWTETLPQDGAEPMGRRSILLGASAALASAAAVTTGAVGAAASAVASPRPGEQGSDRPQNNPGNAPEHAGMAGDGSDGDFPLSCPMGRDGSHVVEARERAAAAAGGDR